MLFNFLGRRGVLVSDQTPLGSNAHYHPHLAQVNFWLYSLLLTMVEMHILILLISPNMLFSESPKKMRVRVCVRACV